MKVKQREDNYFQTQETLNIYKNFIVNEAPKEFEISKADQADLLNKSINFFKEKINSILMNLPMKYCKTRD